MDKQNSFKYYILYFFSKLRDIYFTLFFDYPIFIYLSTDKISLLAVLCFKTREGVKEI